MDSRKLAWIGTGVIATASALTLLPQSSVQALPPPDKSVVVVNTPSEPVPVTGNVSVSGSTTVSGSVAASQSGAWNVGINPAQNLVSLATKPSFFYDSGFSGMNDGVTVDIGPLDLSNLDHVRVLVRAVNGDIHAELLFPVEGAGDITLDNFTVPGESGSISKTFVYVVPPPSLLIRLTESGPGGSNYHVVVVGR